MIAMLRLLFFVLIVRPFLWLMLGMNVRHRARLPVKGPAIIAANHNSHLDTLVLISLLPLSQLHRVRPAASADYFTKNKALAWFATRIIGIIPIPLGTGLPKEKVLAEVLTALEQDAIIILFPEGTRGEPEQLGRFKKGVATLCARLPQTPVYPVFLHGLGKALPKGEVLPVPFFCDVFVGEPLYWRGDCGRFMGELETALRALAAEGCFPVWE